MTRSKHMPMQYYVEVHRILIAILSNIAIRDVKGRDRVFRVKYLPQDLVVDLYRLISISPTESFHKNAAAHIRVLKKKRYLFLDKKVVDKREFIGIVEKLAAFGTLSNTLTWRL